MRVWFHLFLLNLILMSLIPLLNKFKDVNQMRKIFSNEQFLMHIYVDIELIVDIYFLIVANFVNKS